MKIQIENYYGNDIVIIKFAEKTTNINTTILVNISAIAEEHGYNLADLDTDENNSEYIRIQQIEIEDSEEQEQLTLVSLITHISTYFLT